MHFDWLNLRQEDYALAWSICKDRPSDLIIAPDGKPYLYRWWVIPRNASANVYFHIQVASDPDRGLHDHPWDNQSVILAGGYQEIISKNPGGPVHDTEEFQRVPGDVIHRKAGHAHRLVLPKSEPYTMSLFSTGPKVRDWGFWAGNKFTPHADLIEDVDGVSRHKKPVYVSPPVHDFLGEELKRRAAKGMR